MFVEKTQTSFLQFYFFYNNLKFFIICYFLSDFINIVHDNAIFDIKSFFRALFTKSHKIKKYTIDEYRKGVMTFNI